MTTTSQIAALLRQRAEEGAFLTDDRILLRAAATLLDRLDPPGAVKEFTVDVGGVPHVPAPGHGWEMQASADGVYYRFPRKNDRDSMRWYGPTAMSIATRDGRLVPLSPPPEPEAAEHPSPAEVRATVAEAVAKLSELI